MKYIYQFGVILLITFIGELIYRIVPLPIPASIYGLLVMLICLKTGIVKLEKIREAGNFMLDIMPLLFIPAAVGLITAWKELRSILIPIVIIMVLTTVIVMAASGRMTQFIIDRERRDEDEGHIK